MDSGIISASADKNELVCLFQWHEGPLHLLLEHSQLALEALLPQYLAHSHVLGKVLVLLDLDDPQSIPF
jgi:hypothetical protein